MSVLAAIPVIDQPLQGLVTHRYCIVTIIHVHITFANKWLLYIRFNANSYVFNVCLLTLYIVTHINCMNVVTNIFTLIINRYFTY